MKTLREQSVSEWLSIYQQNHGKVLKGKRWARMPSETEISLAWEEGEIWKMGLMVYPCHCRFPTPRELSPGERNLKPGGHLWPSRSSRAAAAL